MLFLAAQISCVRGERYATVARLPSQWRVWTGGQAVAAPLEDIERGMSPHGLGVMVAVPGITEEDGPPPASEPDDDVTDAEAGR